MSLLTKQDLDLSISLRSCLRTAWLVEAKKEDSPTLFSLMGQCFQDISLTKWTNIVGKQYPKKTYLTKENFGGCIRDYLWLPGSLTLVTNWFVGFALPRSLHSCQCMSSCSVECSSSATLTATSSVEQWSFPQCKRKQNNQRCTSLCSLQQKNGARGGIDFFLLLDTRFPPEKRFCGTQHKKQKRPRKTS